MTVEQVEGSFKLNQHKSDVDHAAIANALAVQAGRGRATVRGSEMRGVAAASCSRAETTQLHAKAMSEGTK